VNEPFVAGAYMLLKPGPAIPTGGLTASSCLAEMAPDSWAIDWVKVEPGERVRHAATLGIPPEALALVVDWATEEFDRRFKWPNVFTEPEAAREFRQRFIPGGGVRLVGLGLPADLVPAFLSLTAPPPQQAGYAPVGAAGVHEVLSTGLGLEASGEFRGFEVLGYDGAGQFCSFRCNGLEVDFQKELAAQFNRWGLLDEQAVARRCAEYASRPEVGTCVSWWHPWALLEYAC
jgi:hypothetical protein